MATSILRQLREVTPQRGLSQTEARWVAERQAKRLLDLFEIHEPPVPTFIFSHLPRIEVRYVDDIPHAENLAGAVRWIDGRWVILINDSEPWTRKRWTICHELKHTIDYSFGDRLYPPTRLLTMAERRERAADLFAAAVLVPRMWLKRDFFDKGIQSPRTLARRYNVSLEAMNIRLRELGCTPPLKRCAAA